MAGLRNLARSPYAAGWTAAALIFVAVARIAATYPVFNGTSNEPAHISCGMEWLQFGAYTYEPEHPPLARVAMAAGPFLKGLRSAAHRDPAVDGPLTIFEEGNRILYADGAYWTNLTLARLGALPFFIALCAAVFLWCRRYASTATGLLAVLLLTCTAPLLGHAGVAALDLPCAAVTFLALYQFVRWVETPSRTRAVWLGTAAGVAFLTKLSAIGFVLGGCVAGLLVLRFVSSATPARSRRTVPAALACAVAFVVLWAGYRFELQPLAAVYGPHPSIDRMLAGKPLLESASNALLSIPLPLTKLLIGMRDLWRHTSSGHDSYLLGEFRTTGWWYFFPVVLGVKTPIGSLALTLSGLALVLARVRTVAWPTLLAAVFPLTILGICMASSINVGVRHILPIYPFFAILAAQAVTVALRSHRAVAGAALALVAWTVVDSVRAHPDYLAHFNEFAGSHPERILAESDLDWGQDLARLSRRLRELQADHVSIGYFGSAPLDKAGLPPMHVLGYDPPVPGYIAVSVRYLNLEYAKNGGYAWLKPYRPVERIGQSIDLFYLETIP